MRIGFFTSIDGWGGSEIHLLTLMEGIRAAGHDVLLYGIEGTRLWEECRVRGIPRVAWKTKESGETEDEDGSRVDPGWSHPGHRGSDSLKSPSGKPGASHGGRAPWLQNTECFSGSSPSAAAPLCRGAGFRTGAKADLPAERQKAVRRGFRRLIPSSALLLLGSLRDTLRLARLFRQTPCDVMHVSVNGYELAGLACRLAGIPSLAWHCILPVRDPLVVRRWLIRWTNRRYDRFGGMSRTCIDAWQQWCRLDKTRCCWAWNGIDTARFAVDRPAGWSRTRPFVVLAIGRLHPMKGFDHLIRAFAQLRNLDVVARIAGEGSQKDELRNLAFRLGVLDRMTFLGHQEVVEPLYRGASCLVLPSVSHESFGIVIAEAMASGLPVITSDFGPLPEINVDGETGIVAPMGDTGALANAIRRLMEHPDDAERFGRNGMKRALERFSRQRTLEAMLRIYGDWAGTVLPR